MLADDSMDLADVGTMVPKSHRVVLSSSGFSTMYGGMECRRKDWTLSMVDASDFELICASDSAVFVASCSELIGASDSAVLVASCSEVIGASASGLSGASLFPVRMTRLCFARVKAT